MHVSRGGETERGPDVVAGFVISGTAWVVVGALMEDGNVRRLFLGLGAMVGDMEWLGLVVSGRTEVGLLPVMSGMPCWRLT